MKTELMKLRYSIVITVLVLVLIFLQCKNEAPEDQQTKYGTFQVVHSLNLPGTPETIYDAISGDISGWWDHSFSKNPKKFYLEPKPGGGFWEIFNDQGDGVLHATVIFAERGKKLRFDGPLGLSGKAIQVVTTYDFEALGSDSTKLTVSVHAAGELEPGIDEIVSNVWYHFMFERFKPFIESGTKLNKQ